MLNNLIITHKKYFNDMDLFRIHDFGTIPDESPNILLYVRFSQTLVKTEEGKTPSYRQGGWFPLFGLNCWV
jgi:hypothetical protein